MEGQWLRLMPVLFRFVLFRVIRLVVVGLRCVRIGPVLTHAVNITGHVHVIPMTAAGRNPSAHLQKYPGISTNSCRPLGAQKLPKKYPVVAENIF